MRALIMGCGRVGASVAQALAQEQYELTIIDTDADSFRRLPSDLPIEAVVADGTREEELRRVGIENADVFVAVVQQDTRNALAAQIARHIFRVPKVVCRINDPVRQQMFQGVGLEAISPTRLVSEMIVEAIHR